MAFPLRYDRCLCPVETITALAPEVAMGNMMIATSQALALAALNATNQQQQLFIASQSMTNQFLLNTQSRSTVKTVVDHKTTDDQEEAAPVYG